VDVEKHPNLHTFARLLGFLRPYRWSLTISIVLAALSQAAAIALVRISQSVIDLALRSRDEQMLWKLVALIAVIGFV
jgi:ABC-type bacteriocin/lantibiotic exporter with double-glycine peptidase domain